MSFIKVRTRPVDLEALQWHQIGDGAGYVVLSGARGGALPAKWGVHSAEHGFQNINPGDWIVFEGNRHSPRVYSNTNFHHNFEVVEP
jgi:hypothetical protein